MMISRKEKSPKMGGVNIVEDNDVAMSHSMHGWKVVCLGNGHAEDCHQHALFTVKVKLTEAVSAAAC